MRFYSLKIILHNFKKRIFQVRGNNLIQAKNTKKYKVKFDIVGENNTIDLGQSVLHNILIYVRGGNNILIIENGCYFKNTNFIFEGSHCIIKLGSNTTIEGAHFDVKENGAEIKVGNNCMFSDEVFLTTSDSHSVLDENDDRINPDKSILIDDNVWIGKRVMILKGADIKSNTIIAAGSIVTGNIDSNSIYAGNPARKIRENIHWQRERI